MAEYGDRAMVQSAEWTTEANESAVQMRRMPRPDQVSLSMVVDRLGKAIAGLSDQIDGACMTFSVVLREDPENTVARLVDAVPHESQSPLGHNLESLIEDVQRISERVIRLTSRAEL